MRGGDADQLEIRCVARPDGAELRLFGELTLGTSTGFTDQLLHVESTAPATLVIDLRGLRFLDSTAVAGLVAARRRSRAQGRRLVLVMAPGPVERLFALTQLDRLFETATDPPDAPAL